MSTLMGGKCQYVAWQLCVGWQWIVDKKPEGLIHNCRGISYFTKCLLLHLFKTHEYFNIVIRNSQLVTPSKSSPIAILSCNWQNLITNLEGRHEEWQKCTAVTETNSCAKTTLGAIDYLTENYTEATCPITNCWSVRVYPHRTIAKAGAEAWAALLDRVLLIWMVSFTPSESEKSNGSVTYFKRCR